MDRLTRILLFAALLLAGCQPALTPSPTATPTSTLLPPTATPAPNATVTPAPTPTATEKPYDTTEFDGIFSEKYYPDLYQHDFVLKDEETGTEIPMSFGLTSDMPYTDFELSQIGSDYLADYFLAACNYRKNVTNGNGEMEDADTFAKKVANGEVWIEVPYTDEITGEDKIGNYNPKNGLSIVLTYREDLPKNMFPKSSSYDSFYFITMNKDGKLIFVKQTDKKGYLDRYNKEVLTGKKLEEYFCTDRIIAYINRMLGIFGVVSNNNFVSNNGYVKNPDPEQLLYVTRKMVDQYESIIDTQKPHILGTAKLLP